MSVSVYVLGEDSPPSLGAGIWTAMKQIQITTDREWQLLCKLVQLGAQQQETSSSVNSLLASLGIGLGQTRYSYKLSKLESALSWNGFNLHGDAASVQEARRLLERSDRLTALEAEIAAKQLVRPA